MKTEIDIEGMCEKCVDIVEREISSLNGVEEVIADASSGKIRLAFNGGLHTLRRAYLTLTKLGYGVWIY